MPRKDIDYSKCVIYKIVCNDFEVKDLYVGHTTDLTKRRSKHKSSCNNPNNDSHNTKIYKIIRENGGWENWRVVVVEKYESCEDVEDAKTRERYWFEQLHSNLNSVRPIVTDDERIMYVREKSKKHYQENKQSYANRNIQYYNANKENNKDKYKDKYNESSKKYYINNKEKILEKSKNRYELKKIQKDSNIDNVEVVN